MAKIGETEYATVTAAITAAAGEQNTIVLLKDVTESITIVKDKNVVLDLAGFKLTNVADKDTITVDLSGTLTIQDSSAKATGIVDNVSHGKAAVYNNGTVTLEAGNFTRSLETGKNPDEGGENSYYNILNHGTMTIDDGVTVEQTGAFSSLIANGYFDYSKGTDERS